MPPFHLVIFDMDDTLVSSAPTWQQAERRLFRLLGHDYLPEVAQRYKGMNAWDVARTAHDILQPAGITVAECQHAMRAYLLEAFAGPLEPMPGAGALLEALAGRVPLAVASGSPLEAIRGVLARFAWTDAFTWLLTSEDVPRGKPAPDIFLATAAAAGVDPANALVIEDSLHGVRAAKAAGMTCFVVPSSSDPAIPATADRTFPSLDAMIGEI
jgi:HAD superfamily hydrolase (TIGR01509 family)